MTPFLFLHLHAPDPYRLLFPSDINQAFRQMLVQNFQNVPSSFLFYRAHRNTKYLPKSNRWLVVAPQQLLCH